jgi:hypothetical protein
MDELPVQPELTPGNSPTGERLSRHNPCGDTTALHYIVHIDERPAPLKANSCDASANAPASFGPGRPALFRNKNGYRRRDFIHLRKIALIQRQPHSPA